LVLVYTIGYGNRKFKDFIFLLKKHGINIVADVRRFPKSMYPEYIKENLEQELPKFSIKYMFMGDALGGFRRGYEKYMESEVYREGIKKLLELTKQGKVAITCLERSPKDCHRRYISQTLKDLDARIVHIINENVVLEEAHAQAAQHP